ncbi:MAG: 4-hydroxy-tetrahydrodipicolinate reductase [Micavibrio sp. TMED27]|nr:4-hydroxy-tetrahydrodipicolinate reductase [Micavibrio sp.]OUT92173.1 MAG: 4-hydroxy-tetrahydrodipicolinate reductase [Micavibrio sp. TMED27]|tara:strand:- start:101 stop:865 length:765 start_codon:yes stop_codon:yes gene_type:complete
MKIGITGCTGRVGSILVKELLSTSWNGLELAGGTTRKGSLDGATYFVTNNPKELFERADAVIDFTLPDATREHIKIAKETNTPILIATTGLSAEDEAAIEKLSQTVPVIYAANTSVAVTVLAALVEKAAKALPDYDIEIVEAHHKLKVDAPSGTAIMLGRVAAKARGVNFDDVARLSREGHTGERPDGEIGFSTIRGGDAVGEHTVYFLSDGERIEIKQQASDRSLYARGALKAIKWIANKDNGLFSMRDVLGV